MMRLNNRFVKSLLAAFDVAEYEVEGLLGGDKVGAETLRSALHRYKALFQDVIAEVGAGRYSSVALVQSVLDKLRLSVESSVAVLSLFRVRQVWERLVAFVSGALLNVLRGVLKG